MTPRTDALFAGTVSAYSFEKPDDGPRDDPHGEQLRAGRTDERDDAELLYSD